MRVSGFIKEGVYSSMLTVPVLSSLGVLRLGCVAASGFSSGF